MKKETNKKVVPKKKATKKPIKKVVKKQDIKQLFSFKKSNNEKIDNFSMWVQSIPLRSNKTRAVKKKFVLADFKGNFNFFVHLHSSKSFWWRLLIIMIASAIGGLTSLFFIQNTGIYTYGLSGIVQGISRISKVALIKGGTLDTNTISLIYSILFYGLYIVLNIPLLTYAWKKIGRNFTILSIVAILIGNLFPFCLSFIPNIEQIFLFGDVTPLSVGLRNLAENFGVYLITFNTVDEANFISLFIYAFVSSLINGVCYSLVLSASASTGGTDIISLSYSMRKNKSLSSMITIFNISTVLISVFIGSFLAAGLADNDFSYQRFFSQNLIVAIMYSLIASLVFGKLFPKQKIVKVTIYSEKIYDIRHYLIAKKFNHSFTITNVLGGYSMKCKKNMDIVCFYIELPKLLYDIKKCDKNSFVTIAPIITIQGKINVDHTYD